ncbi:MAG: ribosome maturation factor RimP [Kistimonas sp.]|nr:ribosome maturation factor RimP [Kistimonas sp.]
MITDDPYALHQLTEPVVSAQGCELWAVQWITGKDQALLRVLIDRSSGVSVDDCEAVSRQLSSVLDVESRIPGSYTLEVSSPGMDRPLITRGHYLASVGQLVTVRLRAPFEGKRRYEGLLQRVDGDEVVLACKGHEFFFPLETIEKARVVPRF